MITNIEWLTSFRGQRLRDRVRAGGIHLLISAAIGTTAYVVMTQLVYPHPLFALSNAYLIFLLALVVDVVVGPMLTFLIYVRGKPGLRFDIAVIAVLQFIALLAGAGTLWWARPVFVAYVGPRFDLVLANEVDREDLAKAGRSLRPFGIEWVAAKPPEDPKTRTEALMKALTGSDLGAFPSLHVPLAGEYANIRAAAEPFVNLKLYNEPAAVDRWIRSVNRTHEDTAFLGLRARYRDATVAIDRRSGEVIGIVDFRPWAER